MKQALIFSFVILCTFSCIKKEALKYDPDLVGTWVSNQDDIYTWLTITPDGQGRYVTSGNENLEEIGEVKYSLWETKMFVGDKKFRITDWITGYTDGVYELATKELDTQKDTTYSIDMKMILKAKGFLDGRSITLYRVHQ